jgi:two-component system CheB/CheR fusion protein
MAREGLTVELRAVINKAIKQNVRVRQQSVRIRLNDHYSYVNLEVLPFRISPGKERYYLITFEPVPENGPGKELSRKRRSALHRVSDIESIKLQEELASTRESLQAIIEEQEATNEELRSANEEIMSSNEELQSTNEELTTLNDELESRNAELEQVNNDLHSFMTSVNIPLVMVGNDLRIRRFTNVAEKLLNLIPGDVGRPITDIKMRIDLPDFARLIKEVVDSLQTKKLDVKCDDGHRWSVRIRPYKTTDQRIEGAVVAFVNIEGLKI